jgi:NAD(P)-dependent dehydrogenase (short-subunit alcohol dehydrogenase family)
MSLLDGKTALITGGARGFGRAVALLLAREGADLALADLGANPMSGPGYRPASLDNLLCTSRKVQALGRRCHAIEANVVRAADCQRMASEAIAALGHIDILIANAGAATNAPAWLITEEEWDFVHDVNLKGVFLTTKYVVPHMIERRTGKIVVVASRNGLRVERNYAHYNAAKAGAIHFAKSLALELGPYDINVNAICPTQMWDKSRLRERTPELGKYWDQVVGHENATYEEFDLAAGRDNLFERGGRPDFKEVAEGVLWLVSERSRLVTGLALPMDAGWIVKRGG